MIAETTSSGTTFNGQNTIGDVAFDDASAPTSIIIPATNVDEITPGSYTFTFTVRDTVTLKNANQAFTVTVQDRCQNLANLGPSSIVDKTFIVYQSAAISEIMDPFSISPSACEVTYSISVVNAHAGNAPTTLSGLSFDPITRQIDFYTTDLSLS